MRSIIACCLAILLSGAASSRLSAQAQDPPLAEVPDAAALHRLPGIDLKTDWRVRLGISPPSEVGPWRYLYCLAEWLGEGEPGVYWSGAIMGEPMGPVSYTVDWGEPRGRTLQQIRMLRARHGQRNLFCTTVPLAWKGACDVRIWGPDQTLLGLWRTSLDAEPACQWTSFARSTAGGRRADRDLVVSDDSVAGYPMVWSLPVDASPVPEQGLHLALEGSTFLLSSDEAMELVWPPDVLLARWWVNGQPVMPPRGQPAAQVNGSTGAMSVRQLRVGFGLPDFLGKLKAGDTVGLQIMFSPGGHRRVTPTPDSMIQMMSQHGGTQILIGQTLEFVLAPELLAEQDHPQPTP